MTNDSDILGWVFLGFLLYSVFCIHYVRIVSKWIVAKRVFGEEKVSFTFREIFVDKGDTKLEMYDYFTKYISNRKNFHFTAIICASLMGMFMWGMFSLALLFAGSFTFLKLLAGLSVGILFALCDAEEDFKKFRHWNSPDRIMKEIEETRSNRPKELLYLEALEQIIEDGV